MSLSYEATKRRVHPFDVNTSGASLLAEIHKVAGAPLCHGIDYRVPYSASAEEAVFMADKIDALTPAQVDALCKETLNIWHDMSPNWFVNFVREWARFLRKCGGYATPE
jgi:hypothetical protein